MADFSFDGDNGPNVADQTTIGGEGSGPGASGNAFNNGQNGGELGGIEQAPKKRGRKAYPRDAAGNIIRPTGNASSDAASDPSERAGKPRAQNQNKGVDLNAKAFVPNDRRKVRAQIQGMHQAIAMLVKAPIFLLNDFEADALTTSLCDVLDYHKVNLTDVTGAGGLYVALGLTVFSIYKPRMDMLAKGYTGLEIKQEKPAAPATPFEANIKPAKGGMDFSQDLDPGALADTAH